MKSKDLRYAVNFIENISNSVKELSGFELTIYDLKDVHYDLITILLILVNYRKGDFTDFDLNEISFIFSNILKLKEKAVNGDSDAQLLIDGIMKLSNLPKMIQDKKATKPFLSRVKDLLKTGKTSPHISRGWKINRLMIELSYFVEPICNCPKPKSYDEVFKKIDEIKGNRKIPEYLQVADSNNYYLFIASENSLCQCSTVKPESKVKLLNKKELGKDFARIVMLKNHNKTYEYARKAVSPASLSSKAISRLTLKGLAKKVFLRVLDIENKKKENKFTEDDLNNSLRIFDNYYKKNPEQLEEGLTQKLYNGIELVYQFSK